MQAKEEWWYPLYMKEKCPGLPDWKALNDCAELFATPETAPKGRYLGGPVTWGGFDEERIAALGLNFEVIHAGTDAAMFAELESAYQRQDPILLWIYAPHWAPHKYEGEWVEFPAYTADCYTDPAWGVEPRLRPMTAASRSGGSGRSAGPGWKDKWPGACKAIKAFTIDNDEMGAMIAKVDLDGMAIEDVVDEWMTANEATWNDAGSAVTQSRAGGCPAPSVPDHDLMPGPHDDMNAPSSLPVGMSGSSMARIPNGCWRGRDPDLEQIRAADHVGAVRDVSLEVRRGRDLRHHGPVRLGQSRRWCAACRG